MLLAEAITTVQWVLLGAVILCALLISRRSAARLRASEATDVAAPEIPKPEPRHADWIAQMEVRLHDFAREVEARSETRLARLDALIASADREIIRLTERIQQAERGTEQQTGRVPDLVRVVDQAPPDPSRVSAAQEQIILRLHEAGYAIPEIAHIVGRPDDDVRSTLRAA